MADQTYTLADSKQLTSLGNNVKGWTHRAVIEAAEANGTTAGGSWTTDGDTASITIGVTGPDFVICKAAANVVTAFATDGTLTYEFGTDGDPNNFLTSTDALTAGPEIAAVGADPVTLAGTFATATDNLMVRFTSQAGTGAPADITAGRIEVFVEMYNLNELGQGAP